ncbi:MAG: sensor histidine kinase [Thermonemataceae bacterium]
MYLLVPKVLLKGKLLSYVGLLAAVIGTLVLYNYFLENFFNLSHTFVVDDPEHGVIVRKNFVHFMPVVTSILVVGVSTSVKVTSKWLEDRDRQQKLEKEKLGAELSWLKTQLNPHFFFNILNNIYALMAIDYKSAQRAIHQLSKMMRYVLYETETVPLKRELEFLKNYVELAKLRVVQNVQIEFENDIASEEQAIAPLLFISFVENAFKHGISTEQPSFIAIKLQEEKDKLVFTVTNSICTVNAAHQKEEGIGLNNIKRRLALLYPDRHALQIRKDNSQYQVRLQLQLI